MLTASSDLRSDRKRNTESLLLNYVNKKTINEPPPEDIRPHTRAVGVFPSLHTEVVQEKQEYGAVPQMSPNP